jgi:hypothetical protein
MIRDFAWSTTLPAEKAGVAIAATRSKRIAVTFFLHK